MFYRARFTYTRYYKKLSINENEILLEAFNGANINGNVYYLLLELCKNEDYKNYIKYISLKKNSPIIETYKEILGKWLNETELSKVKIVIRNSKEYCKVLAEAKYLINNVSFPTYFMRKPEQIYLNTWHGTPLKGLGRNIKDDPISIGNVQRNFMHATHLLFPNEYTFDIMRKDYMIEKFYNGKYILTGYPKNDIFFKKYFKAICTPQLYFISFGSKKALLHRRRAFLFCCDYQTMFVNVSVLTISLTETLPKIVISAWMSAAAENSAATSLPVFESTFA